MTESEVEYEAIQTEKKEIVEVLAPFMGELFSHSCMELQKIFEKIDYQEWDRFEKGLKEVLAIGKRMQEEKIKERYLCNIQLPSVCTTGQRIRNQDRFAEP